ncbi:unnamed protein product [Cuscuta epithymum]|uniref:Uncharacterized protein n=1 Tax=Cuscuta epithymum TaxID=186058 RepID=A0AAV0DYC7_9ASTE|nr:unnamed protein product [Cuscuta epithymum]
MHKLEINRTFRNPISAGGMNFPLASHHRRGLSCTATSNGESFDDSLDLFSRGRRSISVASSEDSDVSVKLGRLSVGSGTVGKNGSDDLLSSSEEGKHDYDWLLTPPGTPLVPSSNGNESQPTQVALHSRSRSLARSASATKPSRLSVSQSENSSQPTRPIRSSSVTRPSTHSNKSSNSSILNTSSSSISSYIRQSTPTRGSSYSTRPSATPTSRPTLSRPSTPPRQSQSSRPSTPSASRPQISSSLSTSTSRSTSSRPSTPTRRNSFPSVSPAPSLRTVNNGWNAGSMSRPSSPSRTTSSISRPSSPARTTSSVSRPSSPARTTSSVSRPSSPGPPVRRAPQPIVPPDFSLETPSNLRTSLLDRPPSAGRSRPGVPVSSAKGAMDIPNAGTPTRRQSPSGRGRVVANGNLIDSLDSSKVSIVSKLPQRKPVKTQTESTGFGGTISKKSLDMAIRHMDIRNGPNSVRAVSGSTLFPHSIRSSGAKKLQQAQGSNSLASPNASMNIINGSIIERGNNTSSRPSENKGEEERYERSSSARVTDVDIYESSRYDMLLLKEDVKNTNWLHSIDDKSDATMFDNGFEPLPEPFDPLLL